MLNAANPTAAIGRDTHNIDTRFPEWFRWLVTLPRRYGFQIYSTAYSKCMRAGFKSWSGMDVVVIH